MSFHIIKRPILTEKANNFSVNMNKYAFEVDVKSNKIQIKTAVEQSFNVKVKDVKTMLVIGRTRRINSLHLRTSKWKKAIVTLHDGYQLELLNIKE